MLWVTVLYLLMASFTNSRLKKSNISVQSQSTTTLADKITECWLRQNHTEYQQLLIETKQLQLSLLEQESKNKIMLRKFKQKKGQIDELERDLNQLNLQNVKKKNYLISYYQHLNDKIKSESTSPNLFAKLDALNKGLQSKLEAEQAALNGYVVSVRNQNAHLGLELSQLESKKQLFTSNLQLIIETKEGLRKEEQQKKQEQQKQRLQARKTYESILSDTKKLLKEKQHYQHTENVLKKLLNIQEVHKKHWMTIEKSIKAEFTRRIAEAHFKETIAMQYKLKANQMESLVNQRKEELAIQRRQHVDAKRKYERAKKQLEENKMKFAEVENQMKNTRP